MIKIQILSLKISKHCYNSRIYLLESIYIKRLLSEIYLLKGGSFSRMDVEVSSVASSDNPKSGGRLGVLGYQILGDVHSQFPQLCEVGQLLLVELSLSLHVYRDDQVSKCEEQR